MDQFTDTLASLQNAVSEMVAGHTLRAANAEQALTVLATAADLARAAEALMIEAAAQLSLLTDDLPHEERPTTTYGCRNLTELLVRATRLPARRVTDLISGAYAVRQPTVPTTGAVLPCGYPELRRAMGDGFIGIDAASTIYNTLRSSAAVAGVAAQLAADAEISAAARGEGIDGAPPADVDALRQYAQVWAMYLDQDGLEPKDSVALRKRGVTLGAARDGLIPIRGALLPEVAAQLKLIFDSILNPKNTGPQFTPVEEPHEVDTPFVECAENRTLPQKQHDALATALFTVAGSGQLPTLGGGAPTLVVSTRAEDLRAGRGYAHIDGINEPVSLAVATHTACMGNVQRVMFDGAGRIIELGNAERVFNAHQRKALGLRDGGCVIPGCRVPASWCEIHHVTEHAQGGPTHTDNGVLLCWFHHRTLDHNGWHVRIRGGVPEVKGPYWWDRHVAWRPVTKSPVRQRDRLAMGHGGP